MKAILLMMIGLLSQVALGSTANECLKKVDAARASLLAFKDTNGEEKLVLQTAEDASACLESLEAGAKVAKKNEAIAAWKMFRAIREEKLVPAIKAGNKDEANKLAMDNKTNMDKTKNALNSIVGAD